MKSLFDFDPELVETAMRHKDARTREEAFEVLCAKAFDTYEHLRQEIARRTSDWPTEWLDRARDLFLHDRFLKLFANPPAEKIENFNALCYKLLKDSINDARRFFMAARRSSGAEVHGDANIYGADGLSTFWEAHESEIIVTPSQTTISAAVRVERADLMRLVNAYLGELPQVRRRVVTMWSEGFSEREIAAELGLTTGNVGCIVNRAISFLRKKLCKKL